MEDPLLLLCLSLAGEGPEAKVHCERNRASSVTSSQRRESHSSSSAAAAKAAAISLSSSLPSSSTSVNTPRPLSAALGWYLPASTSTSASTSGSSSGGLSPPSSPSASTRSIPSTSNGSSSSPLFKARGRCVSVDVLVVGNGPAGMALSYMLSGNAPVYVGTEDESSASAQQAALHQRLKAAMAEGSSLLEQNLDFLSEGLEGRSKNPVELLFDTLFHPNIDLDYTQKSNLVWQRRPDLAVSHLVVGAGESGGSWQLMHNSMVTLSYGDWMELPGYSLSSYTKENAESLMEDAAVPAVDTASERVQRQLIAKYYQDYPLKTGIDVNMVNHARVTSVMPMKEACDQGLCACGLLSVFRRFPFLARLLHCGCTECLKFRWMVRIERRDPRNPDRVEEVLVRCNQVVLASGMFDVPKKLGFPGEDFSFVYYTITKGLDVLERTTTTDSVGSLVSDGEDAEVPWMVVVGSGLSAADSVLYLRSQGKNVLHIYHDKKGESPLSRFPRSSYPEYAGLYQLTKAKVVNRDPVTRSIYEPMPDGEVLGVTKQGYITLRDNAGKVSRRKVSRVLVLIGSEPLLSFMGKGVTVADLSRFNPVSFEVAGHEGLYLAGSLTGSKFVRFGLGTTLGVAHALVQRKLAGTLSPQQPESRADGDGVTGEHLDKKRKTLTPDP